MYTHTYMISISIYICSTLYACTCEYTNRGGKARGGLGEYLYIYLQYIYIYIYIYTCAHTHIETFCTHKNMHPFFIKTSRLTSGCERNS